MAASTLAPLLETKLQPPRGVAAVLSRPRLDAVGDRVLEVPLTVVVAPAGFGKSTLLAEWHQRLAPQAAVAWLSLDESDGDPDRFALYLGEAFARALGAGDRERNGPHAVEAVVTELVNRTVAGDRPIVLILDDYQLVESHRVDAAMTFLLEHSPAALHLVIGSRRDPSLPLARLRARRRLLEVRAEELRFTAEEATALLNDTAGLGLAPTQIVALETRTEGWAAALQLAALSVEHSPDVAAFIESFGGSHRFVFDYLAEEVFDAQDEETQTFLLRTSLLERMCGPLCDAVSGLDHGSSRLAGLLRANLFTLALDDEGRWYRYHHLFREFLRRLLEERHARDVPAAQRRASEWLAANGLTDEAVPHALESDDPAWALRLIERAVPAAALRGEWGTARIERWLRQLPAEEIDRRPRLALPRAISYLMLGRVTEAERLAAHAEAVLDGRAVSPDEMSEAERASHRGALAVAQTYIARYRAHPEAALAIVERAMGGLPEEGPSQVWLGMIRAILLYEAWAPHVGEELERAAERCFAGGHLGGALGLLTTEWYRLVLCGRLRDADAHLRRSLEQAYARRALPALGMLHGVAAEGHYERGELDDAEDAVRRCLALGAPGATPGLFVPPEATLARIQIADGRLGEARESLRLLDERARPVETVQGARLFPALAAHLHLLLRDPAAASTWAEGAGLTPTTEPSFDLEYPCLVYARVLIAAGHARDALPLLTRVGERATEAGRHGRALEASVLAATAHWRLGDERAASATFARLLPLAEREAYARTLLDEGEPVRELLQRAARSGEHAGYATRLLLLCGDGPAGGRRARAAAPDELSERELDVLRLLARGFANRDIAEELVVSLDTVKTHLRNAYGKLDAHSRMQAVTRAQERGLL